MAVDTDKAVALAAFDEGFKETVKAMAGNFFKTWITGGGEEAKAILTKGMTAAVVALAAGRQIVGAAFTPPTTTISNTVDHVGGGGTPS